MPGREETQNPNSAFVSEKNKSKSEVPISVPALTEFRLFLYWVPLYSVLFELIYRVFLYVNSVKTVLKLEPNIVVIIIRVTRQSHL